MASTQKATPNKAGLLYNAGTFNGPVVAVVAVIEVPPSFGTASARWVRRRHIDPLARQRRSGHSLRKIDAMVESLEEDART